MAIKLLRSLKKYIFLAAYSLILISFSQLISGCSSEDVVEVTQREKDSIATYVSLQKSFSLYSKALTYNQTSDNQNARESFESSLKYLKEINIELINNSENYFWKQDYNELAKSIVEDYLITQPEVSQGSLVFEFASKIPLTYEKIEIVEEGREPLPAGSDVPFIMNSAVEQYIEFFTNTERGRSFIDKSLYRSGKYFPLMRKILKLNNAPEELIYLSVQESGLNPTITSRAGAVGLWQFMPATGRSYGLDQDGYRDDRRDFEKATDAAAHLLKDLYKTYDDWYLAFSAYNAGPGRVNTAIRKSGSRDFWSLRGFLPGETKNYTPSIIALSYVLRDPQAYGFKDIEYANPISYDRVNIRSGISLQKVSELCESDIETIRELNPEITNDEIPLYDSEYQLRIPHKSYDKFAENFAKSNDVDKSSNINPEYAGTEVTGFSSKTGITYYKVQDYEPEDTKAIGSTSGKKKVTHEYSVKQALDAIAVYYEVRSTDIRIWNSLSYGENLQPKQKLEIYLSEENYKKLYGLKIKEEDTKTENITVTDEVITKEKDNDEKIVIKEKEKIKTEEIVSVDSKNQDNATLTTIQESSTDTESEKVTEESNDKSEEVKNESADSENEYAEVTQETQNTQDVIVETKVNSNSQMTTYTVSEGDNLSQIAGKFNVNVSDLIEWNDLQSDKIMTGQKLRLKEVNKSTSLHIVKEGENLSMIASEYGISLNQLKEINNISDDKILIGQKLKVSGTNSKSSVNNVSVKKTYTVKKGETLASIADKNNLAVSELLKWNNLKSDKIIAGQIIKLYSDSTKTKVRKKKN